MHSRPAFGVLAATACLLGIVLWYARPEVPGSQAATRPAAFVEDGLGPVESSLPGVRGNRLQAQSPTAPLVQSAIEATATGALVVRAVDGTNTGLPKVALSVRGSGIEVLGTTDGEGRLVLTRPLPAWSTLMGRRAGMDVGVLELGEEPPPAGVITLRLVPTRRVQGVVLNRAGNPVGAGVSVVAAPWTVLRRLQTFDMEALLARDPTIAVGETDAAGRFELVGLDPIQINLLGAGGNGWVGPVPGIPLGSSQDPVELTVDRVYGVLVHFREPDGSHARLNTDFGYIGMQSQVSVHGASLRPRFGLGMALAGVPMPLRNSGTGERLRLVSCQTEGVELIPVSLSGHFPGYAPFEAELNAHSLASGLCEADVILQPLGLGHGELELHWDEPGELQRSSVAREGPFAILRLTPSEGPVIQVPLRDSSKRQHVLQQLPYGLYDARIEYMPRLAHSQAQAGLTVEISAERQVLKLQHPPTGSIRVEFESAAGRAPQDALHLRILRPTVDPLGMVTPQAAVGDVSFLRPPYRLDHLEPGQYQVQVVGSVDPKQRRDVRVAVGQVALLRIE